MVHWLTRLAFATAINLSAACSTSNKSEPTEFAGVQLYEKLATSSGGGGSSSGQDTVPDEADGDVAGGRLPSTDTDASTRGQPVSGSSPHDAGLPVPNTQTPDGGVEPDKPDHTRHVLRASHTAVLNDGWIVHHNDRLGLLLIDPQDTTGPKIAGRLPTRGPTTSPSSAGDWAGRLYVLGPRQDRVLLLLTQDSYLGKRTDIPEPREGGTVLLVDIHDRTAPQILLEKRLGVNLGTSWLTAEGDSAQLYLFASKPRARGRRDSQGQLPLDFSLHSLEVRANQIVATDELGVEDGFVTVDVDVAAVAHQTGGGRPHSPTIVDLIDFKDPQGAIASVATFQSGDNSAAFDIQAGVLRAVSMSALTTFDITRPEQGVTEISRCAYSEEPMLPMQGPFVAAFTPRLVFVVNQDPGFFPYFTFVIDEAGACQASDYQLPDRAIPTKTAFSDTRLFVRVATDPPSLDLYDLQSTTPSRLAGADFTAWNDTFVLKEDALAPTAGPERGLAVSFHAGFPPTERKYEASFATFSSDNITTRGVLSMDRSYSSAPYEGSQVVFPRPGLVGRVSPRELIMIDVQDPDTPRLRTPLSFILPSTQYLFSFGGYPVRIQRVAPQQWLGEVLGRNVVPTSDAIVTSFAVRNHDSAAGGFFKVGELLVSLALPGTIDQRQREVHVVDLSDPTAPLLSNQQLSSGAWPELNSGLVLPQALAFYSEHPQTATDPCPETDPETGECLSANERHWDAWNIDILDLRDPKRPRWLDPLVIPGQEEGRSMIADGSMLYVHTQVPIDASDPTPEPTAFRQVLRVISLADLDAPQIGSPIALPELETNTQLVHADGSNVIAASTGRAGRRPSSVALYRLGTTAQMTAQYLLPQGDSIDWVQVQAGTVFVGQQRAENGLAASSWLTSWLTSLSLPDLTPVAEIEIDIGGGMWRTSTPGRLFFEISGGTLMVNVEDPARPTLQAYFPGLRAPWLQEVILLQDSQMGYAVDDGLIANFDLSMRNLKSP